MQRWLCVIVLVSGLMLPTISANAFAVSPAMIELEGSRGDVLSSTVSIINDSERTKTFFLRSLKFEARDESGSPTFIPYDEDRTGLPEWFIFPYRKIEVPTRSMVETLFSIAIPSDAASGGHYAAVVISEAPYEVVSDAGSSINAQTAILVFLTVSGETREQAALLDFTIDRAENTGLNGSFHYRIQNQGNVHVVPAGTITFRNALGMTVWVIDANEKGGRVLPSTTRAYEGEWAIVRDDSFWTRLADQTQFLSIGPITATLDLAYGTQRQTLTSKTTIWYWPIELTVVLAGALAIFLLVSMLFRKARKKV